MSEQGYFVDMPWTWRERLRFKLFPTKHCQLPEAPASYKDVVICKTVCVLDLADRLRILFSGKLTVETRTVTENIVGGCVSSSVCYPSLGPNPPAQEKK